MFEKRIAFKAIVTLVITAIVPIVVFFLIGYLLGASATFASVLSGNFKGKSDNTLFNAIWNIFWWALISIILVGPISFGHVFFIGLPALIMSWRLRIIHWWSTLIMSVCIGALPSAIFVFFFQDIGWGERTYFYQNINVISLGFMALTASIMGFFGLTGGIIFWLLWRYWVSPDSPTGRPLSGLQDVEMKPLGAND